MTERVWAILLVVVAVAVAPDPGAAEVYRWVDARGTVTYADRPPRPDEVATPASVAPPERESAVIAPPVEPLRTGPATIDELLELSGAKAQLPGMTSRIAGEFRPRPGQMSPKDQAAIDRIVGRTFRHEKIYALVRDEVRRRLDRAELEATVAWLRSPVGRKITALEIASSETGAEQKAAAYAASLKLNPPSGRRLELVQRLEWVSGSTDVSLDILAAITRSTAKAMSAVLPPDRRLRPGQIERQGEEVRARASEAIAQQSLVAMLHTYRSLEDEEIEQYVRFEASEAGRWYNVAMRKAVVAAIGGVVEQTALELVRAVPPERWARAAAPGPARAR